MESKFYDISYSKFTIDHPVFRIKCDEIKKVELFKPDDGKFNLTCSFSQEDSITTIYELEILLH